MTHQKATPKVQYNALQKEAPPSSRAKRDGRLGALRKRMREVTSIGWWLVDPEELRGDDLASRRKSLVEYVNSENRSLKRRNISLRWDWGITTGVEKGIPPGEFFVSLSRYEW